MTAEPPALDGAQDEPDAGTSSEAANDEANHGAAGEPEARPALWTSNAALDWAEARRLSSRHGLGVVLFLGEVGTGKTTLLVELWTDLLLNGVLGDVGFVGSASAMAFEERSFESRIESDQPQGETVRTYEEDDGFLHLHVQSGDGSPRQLLLADVTGEHFRSVREGQDLQDELVWAGRVDRFVVLVDGEMLARAEEREVAMTRSSRLLFALRKPGLVAQTARLAVAVTKDDTRSDEQRADARLHEDSLHALAREIDPTAPLLRIAARPDDGRQAWGLDSLVEWMCWPGRPVAQRVAASPHRPRAMARFRL